MKVKLVPTILVRNFSEFENRVKILEKYFSFVQIDCADGKFVKNKTFYEVNKVKKFIKFIKYKGNLELHLIVKEPLKEVKKWIGYKKLMSAIFHFETVKNDKEILEIINLLRKNRIKAGLAINPGTKVEKIREFLPHLDEVLVLGVEPGWGGKEIKLKVVKLKVHKVRKLAPKINIGVDGGVNLKNARQIIKAGANVLYAGYSLNNINNIKAFKKLIR